MKNNISTAKNAQENKKGQSIELVLKELNLHLQNYIDALKSVSAKEQHSS